MIDDGQRLAEGVGLFHVVRGQQDGLATLVVFADDFPKKQPGLRVQAGTGLLQEKYLGVVHHGARDGETLHHAAGESANHLIGPVTEFEAIEQRLRTLGSLPGIEAEIGAVEEQNFASGERKIKIRTLRYHSNQPLDRDLLLPDIMLANPSLAASRSRAGSEDSNRRRLARAVRSQQTEDLSR